jgi:hypothetical protein
MGEVMIITPVSPGEADRLNGYLAGLPRDAPFPAPSGPRHVTRSPFSDTLPPTHFARFVVIKLDGDPHLMFSSRFDGAVADYLHALSATEPALAIWSHCVLSGADGALDRSALERYLQDPRHQLRSQYVVTAFPAAITVGQVNAALTLRDQLSGFAARAARLDQWALAHEFRQLPAIRRLLNRE